jgi:hypothetical protein
MEHPEPTDKTMVAILHPRTREPERVFRRDDTAADESGYDEDDGVPTGRRWYEVTEFPEAPITWSDLEEMAEPGPIAVLHRIANFDDANLRRSARAAVAAAARVARALEILAEHAPERLSSRHTSSRRSRPRRATTRTAPSVG